MTKLSEILPFVQYSALLKSNFPLFFDLVKNGDISFDQLLTDRDIYSFFHVMKKEEFEEFLHYLYNEQYLTAQHLHTFSKNFLSTASPRSLFSHLPILHSFFVANSETYKKTALAYMQDFFSSSRICLQLTCLLSDFIFFDFILTDLNISRQYLINQYKDKNLLDSLYANELFIKNLIASDAHDDIIHLLKLTRKNQEKVALKKQPSLIIRCIQNNYFNNSMVKNKINAVVIDEVACNTIRNHGFFDDYRNDYLKLHNLFVLQEFFERVAPDQQKTLALISSDKVYDYCIHSELFRKILVSNYDLSYEQLLKLLEESKKKKYKLNF